MNIINLKHKDMTDEETYLFLKQHSKNGVFMDADEWKKKRKQYLKKNGLRWSS